MVCGYLLLLLVADMPFVQKQLANYFSETLENKFGTEVKIGKVQLGLFNSVIFDSVEIKDHENRKLLTAEKLSAKIKLRSLAITPITIRTVELYRANINLIKKDENSPYNFQFIIDSLSSKDKKEKSALDIKIKSVILSRCNIKHDVLNRPSKQTFDTNHLAFCNLDASVGIQVIKGDSFNIKLRNIAFQEKSGFVLEKCYANASIGPKNLKIPILQLKTPTGNLVARNIALTSDSEKKYSGGGELERFRLSLKDVRPFWGKDLPNETFDISASVSVKRNRITIPNLRVQELGGNALLRAQIDFENAQQFYVNMKELKVKQNFLNSIAKSFDAKNIDIIENVGDVNLSAKILRRQNTKANAQIETGIGTGNVAINIDKNKCVDVKFNSPDIEIGKLIANEDLGKADINAEVNLIDSKDIFLKLKLASLEFKKYVYKNVSAEARYKGDIVSFIVNSLDPNVVLNAKGNVNLQSTPEYKLEAAVNKFNPEALRLSTKYSGTDFSAKIKADIKGDDIKNAIGSLNLSEISVANPDTTILFGDIAISSSNVSNGKRMILSGNTCDAQLTGKLNTETLVRNFLYIVNAQNEEKPIRSNDNIFNFKMHLKDASLLNFLVNSDVKLAKGAFASGYMDSHEGVFQLEAAIPTIIDGGNRYSDMTLYMKGNKQNTKLHLHASKLLEKGKVEIESNAENKNGELENNLLWKSTAEHRNSGEISHVIRVNPAAPNHIETDIKPSVIVIDDTVWNISAAKIVYDNSKLYIDGLSFKRGNSGLSLNGVASKLSSDSLHVDLHNVRIQNVLDFVAFDDVHFDGNANGMANVANVLGAPHVNASLNVKNFVFNHATMGDMVLDSYWNNDSKKIELSALIRDGQNSTSVNGFVNPAESSIDLRFISNGTNALFLNDFFPDAMQLSQGRTTGNLRLFGNLHAMNLEGRQIVSGLRVGVEPLGTSYTIDSDTVYFSPDLISFPSFRLYDAYHNRSLMSGWVKHRALHDFSYDMELEPQNFLAYDQSPTDDNSSFWGTAFVDGHIHIYGGSGYFTTDANVTPRRKTLFVYNADLPESADNVELLRFRNADESKVVALDSGKVEKVENAADVSSDIRLNFNLNITPDAELRVIMDDKTGNMISAHGQGNISAHFYNKGSFDMFGLYNIEDGTYKLKFQDLIQKNFMLRDGGRINFNGNPLACALNLQAVYTIPAVSLAGISMQGSLRDSSVPVDCIMNITGSAQQPFVNFDIDLPSVSSDQKQMVRSLIATPEDMNMQAMYLLSVGRFYTYNYDMANSVQSQSQTSLAMNSFLSSTLSSNINNLLHNFGEGANNWSFGTNLATGNDGWNDMDVEGMFTGRLFKGRLLIDGNLGYRDRSAYNSNFVGDFSARYLLNPRGTIQLKAYNESNDRYFTKSSMTTQGGGILFRKNFTKVKDLFKKKKKSKAQK